MGNQRYIHRVAVSVLSQIGGVSYAGDDQDWYQTDDEDFPQTVWQQYGVKIIGAVRRMGPSARGRIADCGVAPRDSSGSVSYKAINEGSGFEAMADGREALTLLASYVITAAIVDILRAGVRKSRDEAQAGRDEFDQAEKDYIHHGPRSSRSVTGCRSEITHPDGSKSVKGGRSVTSSGPRP